MISSKAQRNIQKRIFLFSFCGGSWISFDNKTGKFVRSHPYLYFQMICYSFASLVFSISHLLQLYLQMHPNDLPEEQGSPEDPEMEKQEMFAFATTAIAWGEILAGGSILGISKVAYNQQQNIIHMYNVIFAYNHEVMDFLKQRNIALDWKHKKAQKNLESLVYATNIYSVIICLLVVITFMYPIEPTHVLIKEWFEIELKLEPVLFPWIILDIIIVQSFGNLVVAYGLLVVAHCFLTTGILNDLTVERVRSRDGKCCTLETRFFGVLEDEEICKLYRTQRYLNERVNEIMGSVYISFHQVGMLACFSIMLFFFVKFQTVIWDVGLFACALVLDAMFAPLTLTWFQRKLSREGQCLEGLHTAVKHFTLKKRIPFFTIIRRRSWRSVKQD